MFYYQNLLTLDSFYITDTYIVLCTSSSSSTCCYQDSPWQCSDYCLTLLPQFCYDTGSSVSFSSPFTLPLSLCSVYVTPCNSSSVSVSAGLQEAWICRFVDVISGGMRVSDPVFSWGIDGWIPINVVRIFAANVSQRLMDLLLSKSGLATVSYNKGIFIEIRNIFYRKSYLKKIYQFNCKTVRTNND